MNPKDFHDFLHCDRSLEQTTQKIPTRNCSLRGEKAVAYEEKTVGKLQQVKFLGFQNSLRTLIDPQLVVDIFSVIEHCIEADHHFFGDFLVL